MSKGHSTFLADSNMRTPTAYPDSRNYMKTGDFFTSIAAVMSASFIHNKTSTREYMV